MELPMLGEQCSDPSCRQLDFLPIKCDACKSLFCTDHYTYTKHNCSKAFQKNVQVPICPLCNQLVPGKSDELPDIRVSRHIDTDCKSDRAVTQRKKVYSNRCSNIGCKQKELVPITCDKCTLNYCIRHRLPQDHDCKPVVVNGAGAGKPLSKGAMAAMSRTFKDIKTSTSNALPNGIFSFGSSSNSGSSNRGSNSGHIPQATHAKIQGNLSEDAALAAAIQASLNESSNSSSNRSQSQSQQPVTYNTSNLTQEQEDFLLAQAIAESERTGHPTRSNNQNSNNSLRGGSSSRNNCQIS